MPGTQLIAPLDSKVSLSAALAAAADTFPSKPWIICGGRTLSFEDADKRSNALARGFLDFGIRRDDTVLVLLPESIDYVLAWCALSKIGAIEVPVNKELMGESLLHVLNDSRAGTLITNRELLATAESLADKLKVERVVLVDGVEENAESAFSLHDFAGLFASDTRPPAYEPSPESLVSIIYTSGTTGLAKGVMTTQAHAWHYAIGCARTLDLTHEDIYYSGGLPLFHVAGKWGVCYGCLLVGATVVLAQGLSIQNFWNDVKHYQATTCFMLGAVASILYRRPASDEDRHTGLKKVLMVPLIPEYEDFARRFDVVIGTGYGATESGGAAMHKAGEPITDHRVMGKVASENYEVMIVDDQDNEVPDGKVGEIVIRSKKPWIMMRGYWHRDKDTVAAWRNLWFHSGDAGFRDNDGNLFFVDRMKDCIRRRGENISAYQVESCIIQHPSVMECAVYAVPSELTEDDVMVSVAVKPGTSLDETELHAFIKERLPAFMVPRYITFTEEIPKTPTGKMQKNLLREKGLIPGTWDATSES